MIKESTPTTSKTKKAAPESAAPKATSKNPVAPNNFKTCEEFVLALLTDAQEKNSHLFEQVQTLSFSDSILTFLKNYVTIEEATGRVHLDITVSGQALDTLLKVFPQHVVFKAEPESEVAAAPEAVAKE